MSSGNDRKDAGETYDGDDEGKAVGAGEGGADGVAEGDDEGRSDGGADGAGDGSLISHTVPVVSSPARCLPAAQAWHDDWPARVVYVFSGQRAHAVWPVEDW